MTGITMLSRIGSCPNQKCSRSRQVFYSRVASIGRRGARLVCQAGEPVTTADNKTDEVPVPAIPPPAYAQYPPEASYQMDPRYYQGGAVPGGRPQEYYSAPPPGYYPYAPPITREAAAAGPPWFIWVGAGMIGAVVLGKVQEYMNNPKNPQQMLQEMMMKQALGAMGGGQPGSSPFGAPGGMPPFGAAAGASPFAPPQGGFSPPYTPEGGVASNPAAQSSDDGDALRGERFKTNASPAEPTKAEASGSKSDFNVVEPQGKEPSANDNSNSSSSPPKPGFFTDVNLQEAAAKAAASSANVFEQQQQQQQQQPGGGGDSGASENMMNMMETMLRNPEMQKMMYPYLPEPMRNPNSIEWMLKNPEVKKQMAQMFEQQNMMSPEMMEMMKGMDFNQSKVNSQFDELGLKPEDVIGKVMSDPELAAGFSNPRVQAAIMDISQNPMNITKYQEDPEIMKVLEKVTQVFQPGTPPSAR